MKWSALPTHRHLLSVGLATGRTLLMSLSSETLAIPLSASTASNSLPASILAVLPVKYSRPVNATAFASADPNYLATGYERHRSDYSLLIWDLSTAISATPPDHQTPWQRPIPRLDDMNAHVREPKAPEQRYIQHYCASEHVNDIAFLPTSYTLLVSTNNKAVKMLDLRSPNSGTGHGDTALANWTTRAVSDLSPDPSNACRFASFESSSSGSTVRLWDTRKAGSDILALDISGAISSIQWAAGGSGMSRLGVGTKDGVSVWDIIDGRSVGDDGMHEWTSLGEMRQGESSPCLLPPEKRPKRG